VTARPQSGSLSPDMATIDLRTFEDDGFVLHFGGHTHEVDAFTSASIVDQTFFDRLESRQISLRQGDAFMAVLRVHQVFDPMSEIWLNERYEVVAVGDLVSRKPDQHEAGF
jgi:hypothetical protein